MTVRVLQGHVLEVLASLPAQSVHVVVTSPPYWNLRAYGTPPQTWGDGWSGELGSEPTLDRFVAHLVEVFAAVKRVMRDDGTLWVNLGDSYNSQQSNQNGAALNGKIRGGSAEMGRRLGRKKEGGLADGDLCMAPARFALAMQAAGWTLRSELTLCKTAPMPESVSGARWERCRVKTAGLTTNDQGYGALGGIHRDNNGGLSNTPSTEWVDCPGCPKCAAQGSYVQRWGSGRPTSATEKLFLFAKAGQRYFYDVEAVRVPGSPTSHGGTPMWSRGPKYEDVQEGGQMPGLGQPAAAAGRNLWNYVMWCPEPLKEGHYAAFPRWLPRLAIRAGTSERGVCPGCGAPWLRVLSKATFDRTQDRRYGGTLGNNPSGTVPGSNTRGMPDPAPTTLGWRQSCACPPHEPAPAVCLDPFAGSGTTLIEANALGRHGWGIELQAKYVAIAHRRLAGQPLSLFAYDGQEAFEAVGAEPERRVTTKQAQHPNPTVAGFNQRWQATLRRLPGAAEEATGDAPARR